MKKRIRSRLVSLCLLALLLLGLLSLTGCTAANTTPKAWVDAQTKEAVTLSDGQSVETDKTTQKSYVTGADGEKREVYQVVDTSELSTEVKLGLFDYIKLPFSYLLRFLYDLTGSYGWALILFAVAVKLILLPASAKSKKSMMKMSRLTPRVKALEAKFGDDKSGYQQAVNQLYREEGAGGCGGCLWSLLPLLLLIPLYYIIREPITWLMFHGQVDAKTIGQVQNIFLLAKQSAPAGTALHELNATGFYWQMEALPFIGDVKNELAAISPAIEVMNTRFFGVELATVPHLAFWNYFELHGVWNSIGQFLLPMLSGGINMLSMWISQKQNNAVIVDKNGEKDAEMAKQNQASNKVMTFTMPLMSVYIGFIAPAGLSLYWFLQGLLGMVQDVILTKRYKKIYDAEDAVKQARAAEEAQKEAERERLRQERMAANPDGMVGNISKKKQQLREKTEQAAKEAAYLEKTAAKKAEQELTEEARQDASRPNRRGRNYDPNRYGSAGAAEDKDASSKEEAEKE